MYQPKTGARCSCRKGIQRDNCPRCEGTGFVIDFKKIREQNSEIDPETKYYSAYQTVQDSRNTTSESGDDSDLW